jgi:hypothetical protein
MCGIAKAVTFSFNPNCIDMCDESTQGPLVVVKCFDKTSILLMNMEVELLEFFSKPEISNPFEVDILLLHINM